MDEKVLKDAQYRKGLSIAFFNATNAAISLIGDKNNLVEDEKSIKETIIKYRDWLLEEHKNYYATVISSVGKTYNAEEAIKQLEQSKTLEELHQSWRLLSADERHDEEIIKVAKQLKKSFENEKE